jgi:tRNA A-37 threonylcarbamoyl transferase component Bud32
MPVTLEQFVELLSESGIMSAEDVRSFRESLPADKRAADVQEFARELVRQKKLTSFQATAIYQGRAPSLLYGNYVVLDKLGQGGMGMVFKARHRRMNRVVALKVMSPGAMKAPDAVKRFRREVEAAARLTHPNIVAAFDADEARGSQFLVMEYVEGTDLAARVKKHGPLPVAAAVDCIVQAARGLAHAHAEGVVHRDIKPANLLIDRQGTVKVLDMGLARMTADSGQAADGLTQSGSIMGTVDFMSPEQALHTRHADQRADIYSLGCSLHYLLTGRPVFSGESLMEKLLAHREQPIPSLSAARPEIPPALDAVFTRMLAKKCEDRYQTMADVIRDLEAVTAGVAVAAGVGAAGPSASAGAWRPGDSENADDVQLLCNCRNSCGRSLQAPQARQRGHRRRAARARRWSAGRRNRRARCRAARSWDGSRDYPQHSDGWLRAGQEYCCWRSVCISGSAAAKSR